MNRNEKEERKSRGGQTKHNKATKINKQKETKEKTKADDFADKFPNFSVLNEEEKCAFFKALSEARKNVERRGVPTRERFGTVHDEYLKYYDREEQEENQVKQFAVVTSSQTSLHGDSITSPLDQSPSPEAEKEMSTEGPSSPGLLLEQTWGASRQESLVVSEPGPWEDCESVIREESNKMVDLYLKKAKKNVKEIPRAQTAIPRAKATPRFDALNAQEKEIFFRTLQEAHDSVIMKNPGKKSGIPTMNSILERYRGERQATTIFRATDQRDPNMNLKVRVTLTSGDNERLRRTKSQSLDESEKLTETEQLKHEDFEPEIKKENSEQKTVFEPDEKKSDEEENLCQPESSEILKDLETSLGNTYKNDVKSIAEDAKSMEPQESPNKPKSAGSTETKPTKKKLGEAIKQKVTSNESIKAKPKVSSLMSATFKFKSRSREIKQPNEPKAEDKPKKGKKDKKEKKSKKSEKKAKKVEEEIEVVETAFETNSIEHLKCGTQEKDEKTKEIEKLCKIQSLESECENSSTECVKCEAQVSSVVVEAVKSFKDANEEKGSPMKKKESSEKSQHSKKESTNTELKESFDALAVKSKNKEEKNSKGKKSPKEKETPDTASFSEESKLRTMRKNESSGTTPETATNLDENSLGVADLVSSGFSEKEKPSKLQKIVEKKDSLEIKKKQMEKKISEYKKNLDHNKTIDTIGDDKAKKSFKKNIDSPSQIESPESKSLLKRGENLKEKEKLGNKDIEMQKDSWKSNQSLLKKESSPLKEISAQETTKPKEALKKIESSMQPHETTESNVSSPLKKSSNPEMKNSPEVSKSPKSIEEEQCECDSTCSAAEEQKLFEKCSCSLSSLESCTCPENPNCDLPRELSVHNLNTISTSAVKSLVFGSWMGEEPQKPGASLAEEGEEEKPVPEFTSGKVMLVDDNVVDRIRKLIYYLDAKIQKDDHLEKEYMRLLVDYTEYLSRVLESLVSKRRYQAQHEFTAAEARLQLGQNSRPKNKTNQKKKAEPKPEYLPAKIPRSVSQQNLRFPAALEKISLEKTKEQPGKQEVPSPTMSDSGSSTNSENASRFTPLYSGNTNKIITTKVRTLQDLLHERAEFVEGSITDYKIIYHPEQDYVPAEKPTSAQVLVDDEEEYMQQNTNKFIKKLIKCCACGRKKSDDEGIFENLKGEAVRVDIYDDKKPDPVSATLNRSTMEVLKASERKKMIEKYYKKDKTS